MPTDTERLDWLGYAEATLTRSGSRFTVAYFTADPYGGLREAKGSDLRSAIDAAMLEDSP